MEKSIVSQVDFRLLVTRNSRGPRTEPSGTPDSALEKYKNHLEPPVVFYYLNNFEKVLVLPEIPFCSSLKIRPSCHTLSAFEMSRKTALTSKEFVLSKAWWIS